MNLTTKKAAVLIAAAAFFLFISAGCATAPKAAGGLVTKLDALHIEVDPSGNLPPRFWDSYSLMQTGISLFHAQKWSEAAPVFKKIVDEYPQSDVYPVALFNLGACYERMGTYEQAFEIYQSLETRRGPTIELKELRFRQAACLEELSRWNDAIMIFGRLSEMFSLTQIERINTNVRLGVAYFMAGDPEAAKQHLYRGLDDYKRMAEKQLPIDTTFVARGYFTLGELYFDRYEKVNLTGEGKELADRLETKASLLLMARAQYIRCLETYQMKWMAASLHKLGYGYETFYFTMKNYPLPGALTKEQVIEYNRKLDEKTANVLYKAIDAYQRNVDLDREFELHSDWARKSADRLQDLMSYKKENGL